MSYSRTGGPAHSANFNTYQQKTRRRNASRSCRHADRRCRCPL